MPDQAYGTSLDYGIIVVYLVFIFGFGTLLARFNRTTRDFFMGGQRFGAWVIAMSLVATTVGSYSFVKYSAAAYNHGLAASMTYLNDWFWMPLFLFIWLPIIYYGRIQTVPEYFERRFDRRARTMATIILLIFMLGYIGINLLTMGKVAAQLLGYPQTLGPVFISAAIVAAICAIYVASGGQAAVILSDVIQGCLLLVAGFWLFALGLDAIGGVGVLWDHLSPIQKLPLAPLNDPPQFNFIGIFWQDGVANGVMFYFLNQGLVLRFLSARSPDTGRKAAIGVLLVLQILAVVAVANAGWIGRAMVNLGFLESNHRPDEIFMAVAHFLCSPGVFGFILAALTAALMSTADTLINAAASVWVNDVWRPYVRPHASDLHHLKVARVASIVAAGVGLAMVPVYLQVGTIYQAHGAFTAAIGPPMAVAVLMGFLWKRYSPAAAFWTMLGGLMLILVSFPIPELISPLAMGVEMDPNPWKAYSFQRALFGLVVSAVIGVTVTLFTKPRDQASLTGLVAGRLQQIRQRFKGSDRVVETAGPKARLQLHVVSQTAEQVLQAEDGAGPLRRWIVWANDATQSRLDAESGDLLVLVDPRPWLSALRGAHAIVESPPEEMALDDNMLAVPEALVNEGQLARDRPVVVQRIL